MRAQIYFANLKRAITGTTIGSKQAADVNVANTSAIPVSSSELALLEYRSMDAAVTQINKSSGAYVQIGDTNHAAANIANTISKLKLSWNGGGSLLIGKGANAGAVTVIAVANGGQTSEAIFGVSLVAGDKVWIKALQDTDLTGGELLVTLFG